jgi:hypothetical protein
MNIIPGDRLQSDNLKLSWRQRIIDHVIPWHSLTGRRNSSRPLTTPHSRPCSSSGLPTAELPTTERVSSVATSKVVKGMGDLDLQHYRREL